MAIKSYSVGSQITSWGKNAGGIVEGTNGALANGADSGMGRLIGVENWNVALAKARAVAIPADNGLAGSIILAPNTVTSGTLDVTVNDPTFLTAPVGMLVDTEDTLDFALIGVPCPQFVSLSVVINSPAQSATSGAVGVPAWEVSWFPNVYMWAHGIDQYQDGNANHDIFDVVLSTFDRYPWGQQPTVLLNGSTRGIKLAPFFSPAPMIVHTFVGDGSTVTVTLNETPYAATGTAVRATSVAAGVATPLVYGTGAGKYTVVPSTRVLTFGTAPAAGTIVPINYMYVPTC